MKIAPYFIIQEFDNNGEPLAGGLLYTYEAGTSTPKATYTDASGNTANANPIELDSAGRASVWLDTGSYKFVLRTSAGALIKEIDDITGEASNAFGEGVDTITTNTLVSAAYQNNILNCTSAVTLSLIAAATATEGFVFSVKNSSAGNVTIDPDGSELINGVSTLVIPTGYSAMIVCTGTAWLSLFYTDILGANNTFTGDNIFRGVIDVTNVNAETSAGWALRTNGGTTCLSGGAGGSANLTMGGNMSGASTHKLVSMADPTSAQDYTTKNYVDTEITDVENYINEHIVTPWVAYTPTFVGLGTVSGVSMFSRRVGDSLQIRGFLTTGTVTASQATMTIGYNGTNSNVTLNTSKLGTGENVVGNSGRGVAQPIANLANPANTGVIKWSNGAGSIFSAASGTNFSNTEKIAVNCVVPIDGW
jgi:hypothetical protein